MSEPTVALASSAPPCTCLAYDPVENAHTEAEHTQCRGSVHDLSLCGGCDSCISAQVAYWQRKRAAPCPDPFEHDRRYDQREQTQRLTPAQRAAEVEPGHCAWCGGVRP